MKQQLRLVASPRRIAVVRALRGLGDTLVGVPALRALRAHYPDADISYIGPPWVQEVFRRTGPFVDEVIEFDGWPGFVDTPCDARRAPRFLSSLQERGFDLAIQMHGTGATSNAFTALIGARMAAGYYLPGSWRPEGLFVPFRDDLRQPVLWVNLLEALGVPRQGYELEMRILDEDRRECEELLAEKGVPPYGYAIAHPGADRAVRRWDPRYFGEVARWLAQRGLRVLVTGTLDERDMAAAVVRHTAHSGVTSVAGATSIGGLAALVNGARLVVCNDTGISHVCAAVRTPSVVASRPGSEGLSWRPLNGALHRIVSPPSIVGTLAAADDLLGANEYEAAGAKVLSYSL